MQATTLLFYIFAAVTVCSAVTVITARNPMHSVLFLVLTFVSTACIWILLKAEFLAITLVLVYVGAVMVLFLFVVMMLDILPHGMRQGFWSKLPLALFVGVVMVLEIGAVLWYSFGEVGAQMAPPLPDDYSNTKMLGSLLYTDYVLAFETAAVILLVAIIAAIALTLRRRKDVRYNDLSVAVRTRASDRLRMVKMPSQPPVTQAPTPPATSADTATGSNTP